jgi:hypothetical protein
MLLKRSIILAAGVLLFIAAYIIYFDVSHMQMEAAFKAEREKYNVEGVTLTAAETPSAPAAAAADSSATPAPAPAPAPTPDSNSVPTPATPDSSSTPAPTTTPPTPASPDTNSAPAAPASTMDYPGTSRSPIFQLASYRPSDTTGIRLVDMATGQMTPQPRTRPTPMVAEAKSSCFSGINSRRRASRSRRCSAGQ